MIRTIERLVENNSEGTLLAACAITTIIGIFTAISVKIIYTSDMEKCLVSARMMGTDKVEFNTQTGVCRIGNVVADIDNPVKIE